MAIKRPQGKAAQSDINVTPLIDVVLVLLIIFMVLTPIMIEEMAVNLPEHTETVEQKEVPKKQLVAAVCDDGSFALNTQKMPLIEMQKELVKRLRTRKPKIVFVDAHPDVDYGLVVELIDTIRASGADKVGMATLKQVDEFRACTKAPPPTLAEGEAAAGEEVASP